MYSHRAIMNTVGVMGTPNEGGFNTIGAVTTSSRISFNATWVIA